MIRILVLLLLFAAPALAQYPPSNVSDVTIDSQASVVRSESYCYTTVANTSVNFWFQANAANTRMTDVANLSLIRYITIQNMTESVTPLTTGILSVKTGGTLAGFSLTNGLQLTSGASMQINVRRPNNGATYAGVFPYGPIAIWLISATPVKFCATAWW